MRQIGHGGSGYTIIEMMLFISIAGVIFVAGIAGFAGQQSKHQFTQSVKNFDAAIQDIMNDVDTGFSDAETAFSCTVSSPTNPLSKPVLNFTSPETGGSRKDCIFIGKVLVFAPNADKKFYGVFSVLGRREDAAKNEVQNLTDAQAVAYTKGTLAGITTIPDKTILKEIGYGATISEVYINTTVTQQPAIGFFTDFAQSPGGNIESGNRKTVLATIFSNNAVGSQTATNLADRIYSAGLSNTNITEATNGFVICMKDIAGKPRAAIKLGVEKGSDSQILFDNTAITLPIASGGLGCPV